MNLDELRATHSGPDRWGFCFGCDESWPCQTDQIIDHIETLERRVVVLTEALESIVVETATVNSRRSQRSRRIYDIAFNALSPARSAEGP